MKKLVKCVFQLAKVSEVLVGIKPAKKNEIIAIN
jgi:hypothetical protein